MELSITVREEQHVVLADFGMCLMIGTCKQGCENVGGARLVRDCVDIELGRDDSSRG